MLDFSRECCGDDRVSGDTGDTRGRERRAVRLWLQWGQYGLTAWIFGRAHLVGWYTGLVYMIVHALSNSPASSYVRHVNFVKSYFLFALFRMTDWWSCARCACSGSTASAIRSSKKTMLHYVIYATLALTLAQQYCRYYASVLCVKNIS